MSRLICEFETRNPGAVVEPGCGLVRTLDLV